MFRILLTLLTLAILQFNIIPVFAQQLVNLDGKGRALHGYDPVSYYTGKPVKGSAAISHEYQGGQYLFANQENLNEFTADPAKYKFAYGGFCAWAMIDGEKIDVDPERFKKIDGVVYLFYNKFFTDTLDKWNDLAEKESEQVLISRADTNWQQINTM